MIFQLILRILDLRSDNRIVLCNSRFSDTSINTTLNRNNSSDKLFGDKPF